MAGPEFVVSIVTAAGSATLAVVIFRYGIKAVLELFAGVVAIVVKDKRPRAERALDVLRAAAGQTVLGGDEPDKLTNGKSGRLDVCSLEIRDEA